MRIKSHNAIRPDLLQRGFSLVEILVAMIVLSIGLLGLASLDNRILRANHSALFQVQASVLADNMISRMRANQAGVSAAAYELLTGAARHSECLSTTGCDATAMAQTDAFDWTVAVAKSLPAGEAMICIDSTPDDGSAAAVPGCDGLGELYVAKLWWADERRDDAALQRFSVSFAP